MGSKHCRLYDENLVHNIMVSAGLSVMEYLRKNKGADSEEICEFIEINSNSIIEDTIEQLNNSEDEMDKDSIQNEHDDGWPFIDPEDK